jgi:hypothetical protein
MSFDEYIDSTEAAEILGIHKNYVPFLCRKANLEYGFNTAVKRGGRWWIRRDEVEERKNNPPIKGWPTREERAPDDPEEVGRLEMSVILGEPGKPLSTTYTIMLLQREIKTKNNIPSLRRNERGEYVAKRRDVEAFAVRRKGA